MCRTTSIALLGRNGRLGKCGQGEIGRLVKGERGGYRMNVGDMVTLKRLRAFEQLRANQSITGFLNLGVGGFPLLILSLFTGPASWYTGMIF